MVCFIPTLIPFFLFVQNPYTTPFTDVQAWVKHVYQGLFSISMQHNKVD